MRRSSGETGHSATGRDTVTRRALLLAVVATVSAIVTSVLLSPGSLRAQATHAGAENTPHFLRFGKTYVNMAAISHVVSDPGFGLPPNTLQVYFGGQSYVNLYGEDADALRRVLDAGTTPMSGGRTATASAPAASAAPAPATTAPASSSSGTAASTAPAASTKKPAPKKAVPRFEQP